MSLDPISTEEYFRGTLKVIAHWSEVDLSGEWETGLRGVIRSITDMAREILSAHPENPGAAKAEPATVAADLDGGDARPNRRLDSSDRGHLLGVAQAAPEPAAWQWRYVGNSEWNTPSGGRKITPEELKRERPIEQRPLYSEQPAAYKAALENLREAWAALALIRETIETLGPVGAVQASEHLPGPTFMHEAEALVQGIQLMALAPRSSADNGHDADHIRGNEDAD